MEGTDNSPILYLMKAAAPSRSVLITAAALGVTLKQIEIDLSRNEQLQPEFVKINPQHTVPTLQVDGKTIWDSHAINIYLVDKYAKNSTLYPEDPFKRAVVNQRLHFDTGVLFSTGLKIIMPVLKGESKLVRPELINEINEAYGFLEKFLEGNNWVAGKEVTIADFNLLTSVSNVDVLVPVDDIKYPNIRAWLRRAQTLPYHHVNEDGLSVFRNIIQTRLHS